MIFKTEESPFAQLEYSSFSLSTWLDYWYPLICDFLEINADEDSVALEEILRYYSSNVSKEELEKQIQNNHVLAIAPGVHLEDQLHRHLTLKDSDIELTICADGATSYLLSQNIIPDIIVTDLDGDVDDQIYAQNKGAIVLIHIHGDNIKVVQEKLPSFLGGKYAITTQTSPLQGSYNFYGFTDGDRSICLATLFEAKSIQLIGYDFSHTIGKYSKTSELSKKKLERKIKKFTIAKSIINWCCNKNNQVSTY
ncbi:MAG: DUF115 domain-containing protein [Candidatus Heimdallarchaeota archaeon]|nr:DUF115 domain-containing protein [Candidatus Heimdallarchaeota archaeon]